MAQDPILIKRYENRRLYDTHTSRYVNLEDVARMVRQGLDLRVIDAKSGNDQTRRVLIQVILEEAKKEDGGPPLDFLRQMITASDRSVRDFLRWYLGQAMEVYRRFQGVLQGKALADWQGQLDAWSKRWAGASPFSPAWPFGAGRAARDENRGGDAESWEAGVADGDHATAEEPPEEAPGQDLAAEMAREMAELRKRMEEMEQRLGPDEKRGASD